MTGPDLAFGAVVVDADPRLSKWDREVLRAVAQQPNCLWTLDILAVRVLPKDLRATGRQYVFAAVARLEDFGYLPMGRIR